MLRKKIKALRTQHETFLFKLETWRAGYTLSAINDRDRHANYAEYAELELDSMATQPQTIAGRKVSFILSGRRSLFIPKEPSEAGYGTSVGTLATAKSGGSYYGGVPHDTLPFYMAGLSGGLFHTSCSRPSSSAGA